MRGAGYKKQEKSGMHFFLAFGLLSLRSKGSGEGAERGGGHSRHDGKGSKQSMHARKGEDTRGGNVII